MKCSRGNLLANLTNVVNEGQFYLKPLIKTNCPSPHKKMKRLKIKRSMSLTRSRLAETQFKSQNCLFGFFLGLSQFLSCQVVEKNVFYLSKSYLFENRKNNLTKPPFVAYFNWQFNQIRNICFFLLMCII